MSFYQRKGTKDTIAHFRLVASPDDEEAFKRIINYPTRGIGNVTIQRIADSARNHMVSSRQVISNPVQYLQGVNQGTLDKINRLKELIEGYILKASNTDVYQLDNEIVKINGFTTDIYPSSDPEELARQENVEELLADMQDFCESKEEESRENEVYLTDYLQEVALLTGLDGDDGEGSRVSLVTVHAVKRLESSAVFIVGLEEDIFPSLLPMGLMREMREERRLLHMAITRAEKHCIVTSAKNRRRFDRMEFNTLNRFIKDIDSRFIHIESEFEVGASDNSFHTPYSGNSFSDDIYHRYSNRMQSSRLVASQLQADVKPKIAAPQCSEQVADPFSTSFKHQLQQVGRNFKRVTGTMASGGRTAATAPSSPDALGLQEDCTIEHQRFDIDAVLHLGDRGENRKATVVFRNAGIKQLLLKFTRFKVLS